MGHEWMIDVLADLKTFAKQNNLPLMAMELDAVMVTASAEIGCIAAGSGSFAKGESTGTRPILVSAGENRRT